MKPSFFSDFSRRDLMKISLASSFGLSYSGWLRALAAATEKKKQQKPHSCILLWMGGGPSQLDTLDLKPDHKNGGEFKPIETAVPGIQISEHLPGVARHMKEVAIIRSMTTPEGDHGRASYLMKTGYRQQESVRYPSLGSLVAKELGKPNHDLPNFVSVSPFQFGGGGGAGFLGPQYAPLTVSGASNDPLTRANLAVENLSPPGSVSAESAERRFEVLDFLQSGFSERFGGDSTKAHKANYERAIRMVKSQARSAFKLEEEPGKLRDAYGRNRFGQGCLLARRLVERDVPFVEVTLSNVPNSTWDSHRNNFAMVKSLSEVLDPAWSTLMQDLKDRGLLDTTLVVWMGEFGRTPRINPNNGRDHFPAAWSTALAGGGIQGGQLVGDTGIDGMKVKDRPVTINEYYATICSALGMDFDKENISTAGRPISIVKDGKVMPELIPSKKSV